LRRLILAWQAVIQWLGTATHDAALIVVSVPTFLATMLWRGVTSGYRGGRRDATDLTAHLGGEDTSVPPSPSSAAGGKSGNNG